MSKPKIAVLVADPQRAETWLALLRQAMPDCEALPAAAVERPDEVDFAVVWGKVDIGRYRHLKALLSLGAGVDHLLRHPDLPPEVPVIRMVEPGLTEGMREYVALHVLRHHRDMPAIQANQAQRRWLPLAAPLARQRRVGIMGLGALGADAARSLRALGFQVAGWSRRAKPVPGIEVFAGPELPAFLAGSEILVCLLPLTPDTENLLNADLFARLPRGAAVINAARGEHLVEADLLAALDGGQLSAATLDAFRREPLPEDHPFWTHPGITVTPHNASLTRTDSGAESLARAIRQVLAGETPSGLVDRQAGY